jgi:hypothetical protein
MVLTSARGVTLRDLSLLPPQSAMPSDLLAELLALLAQFNLGPGPSTVLPTPMMSCGVRVLDTQDLTLQRCAVRFRFARIEAVDVVAAGVLLQGNCPGLTIRDCMFDSSVEPTYTLVRVPREDAAPAAVARFNAAVSNLTRAQRPGLPVADLQVPNAPPPASPPSGAAAASPTAQLQTEVAASLDVLISKRLAVNLAAPGGVVATAGIVAAPYTSIASSAGTGPTGFNCNLGESTIRDCSFRGLTFATSISGSVTSLRLQDNRATGGIAGIWVLAPNATYPDVGEGTSPDYQNSGRFEELLLARVVFCTTPPPPDSSPRSQIVSQASARLPNPPAPYDLFIVGNQVQLQTASASAALYCLLNIEQRGTEPRSPLSISQSRCAVIISGNRLSSAAGMAIPVALIMLSWDLPCTITGNVVLNLSTEDEPAALWLVIDGAEKGAPLLSVTGNVLHGTSDLNGIARPSASPPLAGWATYNAIYAGAA